MAVRALLGRPPELRIASTTRRVSTVREDEVRAVHGVLELTAEVAEVHRRVAEPALRHQGMAGDHTHTLPAQALVQARGRAAGDGVEHQQRLAAFARRGFSG